MTSGAIASVVRPLARSSAFGPHGRAPLPVNCPSRSERLSSTSIRYPPARGGPMDDLKAILKGMVGGSSDGGRSDLRQSLQDLVNVIAETCDSDLDELSGLKVDRESVRDTVEAAKNSAALLDSCHILSKRVFPDASFQEFSLPRSRRRESLTGLFEDDIRPFIGTRAFVYVAWQKRPERFYYLGRSENRDGKALRLLLDNRAKLLDALQDATVLTICLSPPRTNVGDIEAAILHVLDDHDRFPDFNDRQETVPNSVGAKYLEQWGRFLVDIGKRFELSRDALTKIVRSPRTTR